MTVLRNLAYLAAAMTAWALLSAAHPQVYKCTDASGKTTCGDAPPCDASAVPTGDPPRALPRRLDGLVPVIFRRYKRSLLASPLQSQA